MNPGTEEAAALRAQARVALLVQLWALRHGPLKSDAEMAVLLGKSEQTWRRLYRGRPDLLAQAAVFPRVGREPERKWCAAAVLLTLGCDVMAVVRAADPDLWAEVMG